MERPHTENEWGNIDKESKKKRVVEEKDRNKDGGTMLRDIYLERSEGNRRAWERMTEYRDK